MPDSDRGAHDPPALGGLAASNGNGDQPSANDQNDASAGETPGQNPTTPLAESNAAPPARPPFEPPSAGGPGGGEESPPERRFWRNLNWREWITAGAAVGAALAAMASGLIAWLTYGELDKQRVIMAGQLSATQEQLSDAESAASAADSAASVARTQEDELISANQQLAGNAADQARASQVAANAAKAQALAARTSANDLTRELRVQEDTFNEAYRPRIIVERDKVNDFKIIGGTITVSASVSYRNGGNIQAVSLVQGAIIVPYPMALAKQESLCAAGDKAITYHETKKTFPPDAMVAPELPVNESAFHAAMVINGDLEQYKYVNGANTRSIKPLNM